MFGLFDDESGVYVKNIRCSTSYDSEKERERTFTSFTVRFICYEHKRWKIVSAHLNTTKQVWWSK